VHEPRRNNALALLLQVKHLALLGVTVCVSFALFWRPFLASQDSLLAVLHRIFPTQRGLFEDYVANFW
jgi:alpha-1,3-glucosyltransferase